GNDGLRGIQVGGTRHNLREIIRKVDAAYPEAPVIIAGMRMPPNLGRRFAEDFASVFPDVASETGAVLIPFIGEDVAGRDNLLQMDGIHPTASGHEVIAETVWKYLKPVLRQHMEMSQ
ncbi:GDSL-type esterase/lipase family protein, partial [Bacteroidota bacterium]